MVFRWVMAGVLVVAGGVVGLGGYWWGRSGGSAGGIGGEAQVDRRPWEEASSMQPVEAVGVDLVDVAGETPPATTMMAKITEAQWTAEELANVETAGEGGGEMLFGTRVDEKGVKTRIVYVREYTRKDGTVVRAHTRRAPERK